MPLVDKLSGHKITFPDKPYLEQPNNGGKFCQGTVYVPTKQTCLHPSFMLAKNVTGCVV